MNRGLFLFLFVSVANAQEPGDGADDARDAQLLELAERIESLEAQLDPQDGDLIDLSGDELPSIQSGSSGGIGLPWFENVELSGFVAANYFDSGGTGVLPNGSFLINEAFLFLDARVWEDTSFFLELQAVRFAYDYDGGIRTGEVYASLWDLWSSDGETGIGVKAGRFDVPFGEEYLWQDQRDNPLITSTAAHPYGVDEGILVHGTWRDADWIVALTNGNAARSMDGDPARAVSTKLSSQVSSDLFLSASAMTTGDVDMSAIIIGSGYLAPVGALGGSTLGASPSNEIDATLWELDARYEAGSNTVLSFNFGQAYVDDDVDTFDRDLTWFMIEPRYRIGTKAQIVVRYSEAGTFDDDEGYFFDGKEFSKAREFGYDTSRHQRLSAGVEWTLNPNTVVKAEVGHDWFDLIDASTADDNNDERLFFGFELVVAL